MKPGIQERMNNQIQKSTIYNALFDVVVTTSEESLGATAVNPADNQYNLETVNFVSMITCNDDEWNTITIGIDDLALGTQARVADLRINIHGDIEEVYHNIPRSIRSAVMNYVNDIFEAVERWINSDNLEEGNND